MKGKVIAVALTPHPPIMLENIAKEEFPRVQKTNQAMVELAEDIKALKPEAYIIITPHGPIFSDAVVLLDKDNLCGDLAKFGAPEVTIQLPMHKELAKLVIKEAGRSGIYAALLDEKRLEYYNIPRDLDHGVVVPMSFFGSCLPPSIIVSMGMLSDIELYTFGIAMANAIEDSGQNVVIIISGDLSHKLTTFSPAGYHQDGNVFDNAVCEALISADFKKLFIIPEAIRENAGECGFKPILMGLGALEGIRIESKLYSYEAPFGVGYAVASFLPQSRDPKCKILEAVKIDKEQKLLEIRKQESPVTQLARITVERYITANELPDYKEYDIGLNGKAGVFVSIKKDGNLRGCIGSTAATTNSIPEEIIRNAVAAATEDPRFFPITKDELSYLTYSVDILTPSTKVKSLEELNPQKYGIIVKNNNRSGLLLPDLEGVDTTEKQLEIVLNKAGIHATEKYEIYKFEVIRYK